MRLAQRHNVHVTGDGPAALSIAVHNHGRPIPQALLATIFLPMTRGENVNASGRSVGLGLYIVSEIARAHGGAVTVRSSEQEGTGFTATFPAAC